MIRGWTGNSRRSGVAHELDLERLLGVLDRNGVTYVLIGGMAAVAHGSPLLSVVLGDEVGAWFRR